MTPPTATTIGNAKGKLLEFCARAKVLPPTIDVEQSGERWGVMMTLLVHDRSFESGMQWARTRTGAEQRAAHVLLGQLAAASESEPAELVTKDEEAALRRENPKGLLLERCVALRLTPVFDVQPVLTRDTHGFEASVCVSLSDGEELWSDIRRARSAKGAEQAAASSLLTQLPAVTVAAPPRTDIDARSALNELRQTGGLRDYGFVIERVAGPPHAPEFFVKAFAVRPDGARVEAPSVAAPSKKEAERRAAERLFAELGFRHSP